MPYSRRIQRMIDAQIELRRLEEATRMEALELLELQRLEDLVEFGRCEWTPEQISPTCP